MLFSGFIIFRIVSYSIIPELRNISQLPVPILYNHCCNRYLCVFLPMYDYFYFSEIVGLLHRRICTFIFLNYVEIASQKCSNYSHSYKQQMKEPISPHHPKLWQFSIIYVLLINWVKMVSHSFNLHSPDFQWGYTSFCMFTHHVCSLRYDLPLPFLLMAVGLFLNILYSPWDTNLLSIKWVVGIFPPVFCYLWIVFMVPSDVYKF